MSRAILLVLPLLLSTGCAREAVPAELAPASAYPDPSLRYGWPPPQLGSEPLPPGRPLVAGVGLSAAAEVGASPSHGSQMTSSSLGSPRVESGDIPAGEPCLAQLEALGIAHHRLSSKRGVDTPVALTGPIGGITWQGGNGGQMVCDCRFAVALHRISPILSQLGISSLRYSGAYSYRMSRVGRLSLHAHGLAIDVHGIVAAGQQLDVSKDFARGLDDGCAQRAPILNQLACRLKHTGMFKELLTPDYNADHHDHLHLAIAALPRAEDSTTETPQREPRAGTLPSSAGKPQRTKPRAGVAKSQAASGKRSAGTAAKSGKSDARGSHDAPPPSPGPNGPEAPRQESAPPAAPGSDTSP